MLRSEIFLTVALINIQKVGKVLTAPAFHRNQERAQKLTFYVFQMYL